MQLDPVFVSDPRVASVELLTLLVTKLFPNPPKFKYVDALVADDAAKVCVEVSAAV